MKITAQAPSNIAFTKYWGKKGDPALKLPENASISMNLSGLTTVTTVEFDSKLKTDKVVINGETEESPERVSTHLDVIRKMAGIKTYARVVSKNNFPMGTGLSSSASSFAALSLAGSKAAGLNLTEKELSILARQGSGSACRSIPNGFIEWLDGDTSDSSYAVSLHEEDYWNIRDVVAIVSSEPKKTSSTKGQESATSSPFYAKRLEGMKSKNNNLKKALEAKDFKAFGEIVESDALELHAIMLTSHPALIYWTTGTLKIMKLVSEWRSEGLSVYFTVNTGQDIHLIVQAKDVNKLEKKLQSIKEVKTTIVNEPTQGARQLTEDLF